MIVTAAKYVRWISYELRHAIYMRDGYTCVYCGKDLLDVAPQGRHLDHVVARHNGGTDDVSNLVTACASCNCSKQAKPLSVWAPEAIDAVAAQLALPVDVKAARAFLKARREARKAVAA